MFYDPTARTTLILEDLGRPGISDHQEQLRKTVFTNRNYL